MEDPLEHKWDHLEPPTKYTVSVPVKFWQIKWVFQKLKGLFKKQINNENMSKVIAKMVCVSVADAGSDQVVVKLEAVVSGSEENKSFSRWTPSASLQMYISNETPAGDFFE